MSVYDDETCFVCGVTVSWRAFRLCSNCQAWADRQPVYKGWATRWLHQLARDRFPSIGAALAADNTLLETRNGIGTVAIAWLRGVQDWPARRVVIVPHRQWSCAVDDIWDPIVVYGGCF